MTCGENEDENRIITEPPKKKKKTTSSNSRSMPSPAESASSGSKQGVVAGEGGGGGGKHAPWGILDHGTENNYSELSAILSSRMENCISLFDCYVSHPPLGRASIWMAVLWPKAITIYGCGDVK
jgi:hypothetical protein